MIREELGSALPPLFRDMPPELIADSIIAMSGHSPHIAISMCRKLSNDTMQQHPDLQRMYREALQNETQQGAGAAAADSSCGGHTGGGSAAHLVEVEPLSLMPADLADAERMLREIVDPKREEPPVYHDLVRLMRLLAALHGEGHMRDFGFPQLVQDLVCLFRRRGLGEAAVAERLRQSFKGLSNCDEMELAAKLAPAHSMCSTHPLAVELGSEWQSQQLKIQPLGIAVDASGISFLDAESQHRAFAAIPPQVEFFLTTAERAKGAYSLTLYRARIVGEPSTSSGVYKIVYRRPNNTREKTGTFGGPKDPLVVAVAKMKGDPLGYKHKRNNHRRDTVETTAVYKTAMAVTDAASAPGDGAQLVRDGLDEMRWASMRTSELLSAVIQRQQAARVRLIAATRLPTPSELATQTREWSFGMFPDGELLLFVDILLEVEQRLRSKRLSITFWRRLLDTTARVAADTLVTHKRSSATRHVVDSLEQCLAAAIPVDETGAGGVSFLVALITMSLEWVVLLPGCREKLFTERMQPGHVAGAHWLALVLCQYRRLPADRFCAWCSWPAVRRCGGCRRVAYCSRRCQKAHWTCGHPQHCQAPTPFDAAPTADEASAAEQCNAAGHKLYADGKPSEAAAQYAAATRLAPRAAKYYGNLAQARLDAEDLTGAEEAARAALVRLDADEASGARAQTTADPASHTQRAKWGLRLAIALERQGRREAALTALTEPRVFRAAMAQGESMADEVLRMRARCERALLPTRTQLEAVRAGQSGGERLAADVDDERTWETLGNVIHRISAPLSALVQARGSVLNPLAWSPEAVGGLSDRWHMSIVKEASKMLNHVYVPAITACRSDAGASRLIAQAQLLLEAALAPMVADAVSLLSDVGPSRHLGVHGVAVRDDDNGEPLWDERTTPKVMPTDALPRVAPAMALHGTRVMVVGTLAAITNDKQFAPLRPLLQACAPNIDRRVREMFAFARSETTHMGGAAHPDMSQHFLAESGDYPTFGAVMWRILQGCRLFDARFNLPGPRAQRLPEEDWDKAFPITRENAAIVMGMCASDHIGYNCDDAKFREQLMKTVTSSLLHNCCVMGDPRAGLMTSRGEEAGKRLSLLAMPLEWEESSKWPLVRRHLHIPFPGR